MRDFEEYEFTRKDGTKVYEIVDLRSDQSVMSQLWAFMRLHKATAARKVR